LLFAALIIAQLRLRDDLHDIPHDRLHAPDRVLVTCQSLTNWYFLLTSLFFITGAGLAMFRSLQQLAAYALLCGALEGVYRVSSWQGPWRLLRNHLIILKYPALLLICSTDPHPDGLLQAGGLVYLALSSEELVTDPSLKAIPLTRGLLILDLLAFSALALLVSLG
jgi:hypothetical protein